MTVWLADAGTAISGPPAADFPRAEPDFCRYRVAVSDLVAEIGQCPDVDGGCAEHILGRRLPEEPFADVLAATPGGRDEAIGRLLFEARTFEPDAHGPVGSLVSMVRISMLAQIDAVWWGRDPGYRTDSDVLTSPDLVDVDELENAGRLRFSYRHQATTLLSRAARSAQRRTMPGHAPRTAGLRLARARPQAVAWLNQLADDFARLAPRGTPPLWVTSLARSVAHQRRLRELGYVALTPSAHCVGYAADVEMAWYRRFRAHRILRGLLLDRQRADEVNVIDEGQAWHVCLRPEIVQGPRRVRRPAATG